MEILRKLTVVVWLVLIFAAGGFAQETRDPVDFRKLTSFLIDLDGWEATGEAEGQTITMGDYKASEATRNYRSGDLDLEIKIADYTYYPMIKQSLEMMKNFQIDSSEKYVKTIDVDGFPAVVEVEYDDQDARLIIFLENSVLVMLEADPVKDHQILLQVAGALDLKGLSAL